MTEAGTDTMASTAQPTWHALGTDEALQAQGVDAAQGLSSAEVADAVADLRPQQVRGAGTRVALARLPAPVRRIPMQIVLLVAGVICLFLPGQIPTGVLLILLTLLNAWMGMNQEGKAEDSVAALQKMMVVKARVIRDGQLIETSMDALVPGDIVNVEAGDLVPADARILRAATLEIDESALTGESAPVPKQVRAGGGRRRAGRPRRHGVHEHPGHPRLGDLAGHDDRDGHRGRPHLGHAVRRRRSRTRPLTKQLNAPHQPDPGHRRRRARGRRCSSACTAAWPSRSCS